MCIFLQQRCAFVATPRCQTISFCRQLQDNSFCGPIASSLGEMTQLTTLCACRCFSAQFTLVVPHGVHREFVHRTLNNNFFSGTIPESFGNLASLQYLAMQTNQIQGSLPAFLGNLTALVFLYVLDISYVKPLLVTRAWAGLLEVTC